MKLLALESSAAVASVALIEDERVLAELTLDNGNTHSETLLPAVAALLRMTESELREIGLFAVSVGPGSFTGIRIGAATVKGLAFGTEVPCIGTSSLESLAYNLRGTDGLVCPVLNARRRQVYTALFRVQGHTVTRLCEDTVLLLDELDALLAPYGEETVAFVGDAYDAAHGTVTHGVRPVPCALRRVSAASVAAAALAAYNRGERGTAATLKPIYLRPCQAERERLETLRKETEKEEQPS